MPASPMSKPRPKTKSIAPRTTQSKLNFGPPAKGAKGSQAKTPKKPANGNILNFFKKVEVEEQLFCVGDSGVVETTPQALPDAKNEEDVHEIEHGVRDGGAYDGGESTPKRRKLSHDGSDGAAHAAEYKQTKRTCRKGPFLYDSDSEDDVTPELPGRQPSERSAPSNPILNGLPNPEPAQTPKLPLDESCPDIPDEPEPEPESEPEPETKLEDSYNDEFKDLGEIEGLFDDDDFDFGEEFRERRYMEAQARLEVGDTGDYTSDGALDEPPENERMTEACPLCSASLVGITTEQATIHVNACLDGNPIPLPAPLKPLPSDAVDVPEVGKRFARAAVPRPGQANPIRLGSTASPTTSAFSKLMSGHAEDAAWASAAASEQASRGKPAYQRTCPFYKIMPGFFICVDAFRYGAVKGCKAYFLSHFHSDHYIGLTANWSHGPIYCSKVTGSLIKNQLRTATRWIKELEFEEKVEVPGTDGVMVTMLPANHCPGSSLFLFEKAIGKGPSPKLQRILHCGDFRACPAQVTHLLLKPDVVDAISGKVKQQKIDVCYLDTTYLNPRYSFPPQDDVIKTCTDFCKAISKDPSVADRALNKTKREKGSTTVSQFFQKEDIDSSTTANKDSAEEDEGSKAGSKNRLLVICGTYSIGKERICKAIAQALQTKIFASPSKIKICAQLGDPELTALLTSDPLEAQVHMQMLMEIRAETLQDYLDGYKPHFTRIVGFRPSGWNYRPGNQASSTPTMTGKIAAADPGSSVVAAAAGAAKSSSSANVPASASPGAVPTTSLLHGPAWRPRFRAGDLSAQRGSTREAMCFGVPYSEHSSFRELALFLMSLRVERVVPTVNVGSEAGRRRMKAWTDRWLAERRRGGCLRVLVEGGEEEEEEMVLWDGKDGRGGGVWW